MYKINDDKMADKDVDSNGLEHNKSHQILKESKKIGNLNAGTSQKVNFNAEFQNANLIDYSLPLSTRSKYKPKTALKKLKQHKLPPASLFISNTFHQRPSEDIEIKDKKGLVASQKKDRVFRYNKNVLSSAYNRIGSHSR